MRAHRTHPARQERDAKPEVEATGNHPVYEKVVGHVQSLVGNGSLKPGDKLPSERELAQKFQIGRSSVRAAIRILEVMGLVKPRQGEGTVVRDLSPDSLVVPLASLLIRKRALVEELMDVRSIIEPPLAARAAKRASQEQIAKLEEILDRQRDKVRHRQLAVEEDFEFHYTIATAAGNAVVLSVLDVLMDLLAESRGRALQVKGRPQRSLQGHRSVLSAIKRRAPGAAEAAMRRHIRSVKEIVLKKL